MISLIFSYIAQSLLVIISLFVYVLLVAMLFPRLFLQAGYPAAAPADRGIKKYSFPEGRAVVYQPAIRNRAYIEQYILSDRETKKYITCRFGKGNWLLRYSILAFDADGHLIKTIDTEASVNRDTREKELLLPDETAYTNVIVREVDGVLLPHTEARVLTVKNISIFAVLTVVCTVLEALVIKNTLLLLAELMTSYSQTATGTGMGVTVVNALLAGVVCAALVLLFHLSSDMKITKQ